MKNKANCKLIYNNLFVRNNPDPACNKGRKSEEERKKMLSERVISQSSKNPKTRELPKEITKKMRTKKIRLLISYRN
jgi:hypothetical protein